MRHNIDFSTLYQEHMARSGRKPSRPSRWDAKAESMRTQVLNSEYAQQFVSHVQSSPQDTLLDVGSGPGTIGLALAPQVKQVYCLDYSPGMLAAMELNAKEQQLTNVSPILASWEDDWSALPRCDITVVSRASIVADIEQAIRQLHLVTHKRIYLTQLVGGRFSSPEIARLLHRPDTSFPDHMYLINLLYQQHIYPTLNYISAPSHLAGAGSCEEFIDKVAQRFGPLSTPEQQRLIAWYHDDPAYAQQGGEPQRWALLSWSPPRHP
ncbi:MAG: class I SAM-dependent methyltransferase [Oceanisphaera sp.]